MRYFLCVFVGMILLACDAPDAYRVTTYGDGALQGTSGPQPTGTPEVLWSYALSGTTANAVQPFVDDGRAYVAADSLIRCVEAETGALVWTRRLGVHRSLGGRALVGDSARVYLNHFDTVWAVNRDTGALVWRTVVDDFEGVDLQGLGVNATHLLLGGVGEVVRIRRKDGGIDRRIDVPRADSTAPVPFVLHPSLADDGTVVAPSFYRRPNARHFEGALHVFNPDGTLRWHRTTETRTQSTPEGGTYTVGGGVHGTALAGSTVTYATGQTIAARRLDTGARVWARFTPAHGFGIGPSVHDSLVFAGSTGGRLFAWNATTGEPHWTADVESGLLAPTVVHRGVVYQIDDGDGALWAFDRETGTPMWSVYPPEYAANAEATFRTPPGVDGDVLVVVGARRVYALRTVPQAESRE